MYMLLGLLVFSIPFISCDNEEFENFGNKILDESVNRTIILELAKMKTVEFIEYYGYPCETHKVTTKDGYILTLHRVKHGKNGGDGLKTKPIVVLQHGIFQSSKDWFSPGPEKCLGFLLADAGYDVWASNIRGNMYSRNHTNINPNDYKFWNFTYYESGVYDAPAIIDYILDHEEQQQLSYIAYSQGTTILFTMLSELPEYNDKIKIAFAMAPVVYMSEIRGGLKIVFDDYETLLKIGDLFGIQEVSNNSPVSKLVSQKVCDMNYFRHMCIKNMFDFIGYDMKQFNVTLMPILNYYFPCGSSVKSILHFYQEYKSGEFCRFDYGTELNQQYYGSPNPPKYNLKNVNANVHLIYALNDYLSNDVNVERLYAELPEGNKHKYLISYPQWNHMDYLAGMEADKYVYSYIMEELLKL